MVRESDGRACAHLRAWTDASQVLSITLPHAPVVVLCVPRACLSVRAGVRAGVRVHVRACVRVLPRGQCFGGGVAGGGSCAYACVHACMRGGRWGIQL